MNYNKWKLLTFTKKFKKKKEKEKKKGSRECLKASICDYFTNCKLLIFKRKK